jgi:hypothetical protein
MRILQATSAATRVQVTTQNLYASVIVVSGTASTFLGDDTVSTTNGQPISATVPLVIVAPTPRGIPLNSLWVVGAAGPVNFLYEPSA